MVYVSDEEIDNIAGLLNVERVLFLKEYLFSLKGEYYIKEDTQGACVFFRRDLPKTGEGRCIIYPVRPSQCKSFPFWFQNLRSEAGWKIVSSACPGIGKGHVFKKEEILDIMQPSLNRFIKGKNFGADNNWS